MDTTSKEFPQKELFEIPDLISHFGLKPILLEHQAHFEKYFNYIPSELADMTFTMRYAWGKCVQHSWKMIDDYLCVFGYLQDRYVVWGPACGKHFHSKECENAIRECFAIADAMNEQQGIVKKSTMIYIPDCLYSFYSSLSGFKIEPFATEFLYNTTDLIDYPGTKYKSKRSSYKKFLKCGNISVEPFRSEIHTSDCLQLINKWLKRKQQVQSKPSHVTGVLSEVISHVHEAVDAVSNLDSSWYNTSLELDYSAAASLLPKANDLGAKGVVVYVNGVLAGFIVGEQVRYAMSTGIVGMSDYDFPGSFEFTLSQFARICSETRFINTLDDFGVEALRNYKLSFRPVHLLPAYKLTPL